MANLNGQYIAALDPAVFRERAWEFAAAYPWRESVDRAKFDSVADLMQTRTKLMTDLASWTYFFAVPVDYDPKGVKKFLTPEPMRAALAKAADAFDTLPENDPKAVEDALRAIETAGLAAETVIEAPMLGRAFTLCCAPLEIKTIYLPDDPASEIEETLFTERRAGN